MGCAFSVLGCCLQGASRWKRRITCLFESSFLIAFFLFVCLFVWLLLWGAPAFRACCQVAASCSWAGNILVPPYPERGVLACTVKHTLFQTDIWWKEVMLILHFSHKLTTTKTSCSLTQQCCILWRDLRKRDAPLYVHRLFPGDSISSGSICYCCTVAYFDLNDKGLQLMRNDVYHCHILRQGRDFTCRPLSTDKSLSLGLA